MVVFSLKCDVCKTRWEEYDIPVRNPWVSFSSATRTRDTVKEARTDAAKDGWTFVRGWDLCRACAGKQPAEAKEET